MAKLTGIATKLKGSAGEFTFSQRAGATVVKQKISSTPTTKTKSQMYQRMKWANIISFYKLVIPMLLYAFENKKKGISDYNQFVKLNLKRGPIYLTKDEQQAGSVVATDYQITQGSLDSCGAICTAVSASVVSVKSNILLGNLSIGDETTIKEVSDVIVSSNEDFQYGDQISCLLVTQRVNESGYPKCSVKKASFILSKSDDRLFVEFMGGLASLFDNADGFLGGSLSIGNNVGVAYVHSRKTSDGVLVSTEVMAVANNIRTEYNTEEAYETAAESYGGYQSAFLNPNDSKVNGGDAPTPGPTPGPTPEPDTYTVTLNKSPENVGNVTGGGEYEAGATAHIKADTESDYGWAFLKWSDNNTNAERDIVVNSDITLTAIFTES